MEELRFPSPDEARRSNVPSTTSADATQPARAVVVRRAEPVVTDDEVPVAKEKPKLTPDEIRALLAVEGVNRPQGMGAVWKRGRVVIIPVGLINLAMHLLLGSAAPFVMGALTVFAFVWCAIPLLRRDEWS